MALAYVGTIQGLVIELAGHAPLDAELAERAVRELNSLPLEPASTDTWNADASIV